MKRPHIFSATVWLYPGETGNWHFVTLPKVMAVEIKEKLKGPRRGFGSVRVTVTIGKTTWDTSIFPDRVSKSYLLPLKTRVRKSEDIEAGETVTCSLRVL